MKIAEDLRDNLHRTRLVESAVIRQMDVFAFLREAPTPFGVIFVAPPQWVNLWPAALKILDVEPKWLDEVGVIVVQHYPANTRYLPSRTLWSAINAGTEVSNSFSTSRGEERLRLAGATLLQLSCQSGGLQRITHREGHGRLSASELAELPSCDRCRMVDAP